MFNESLNSAIVAERLASLASCGFLESPFALRKQRIRNFRGAKGDTYFPLDAYLRIAVRNTLSAVPLHFHAAPNCWA